MVDTERLRAVLTCGALGRSPDRLEIATKIAIIFVWPATEITRPAICFTVCELLLKQLSNNVLVVTSESACKETSAQKVE